MAKPTKRSFPVLERTWGERFESERAESHAPFPKTWQQLEREAAEVRDQVIFGVRAWPPLFLRESILKDFLGRAPTLPDINYPAHFIGIPTMERHVAQQVQGFIEQADRYEQLKKEGIYVGRVPGQHPLDVLMVEAHTAYSHLRWAGHGRRVYIPDVDTFELLAHTDLPRMPARYLTGPAPTFWLQFPPDAYRFRSSLDELGTTQIVDGVMVSFSDVAPRGGEFPRQLTLLICGKSLKDPSDDNVIYFSELLDDTPTSDLFKAPEESGIEDGLHEVSVLTPRAVLNFCLYLMQEQPLLQPVAPQRPRSFAEVRSPKQRAAAQARDREARKNHSSLGYIYVGRPFAEGEAPAREPAGGRVLRNSVWVRGHWRSQPHGPRRRLRKLIHIEPYWKARDLPAAPTTPYRVQPAEEAQWTSD